MIKIENIKGSLGLGGRRFRIRGVSFSVIKKRAGLLGVFLLSFALVLSQFTPARAAITYVGSSSAGNSGATTLVIPAPAGVAVGDLLIFSIENRNGAANSITPSLTGTTIIRSTLEFGTTTISKTTLYKYVTVVESSYTVTFGSSVKASGGVVALRGVATTNPIDVSAESTNASSTTATAPSVTATVAGAYLLNFYGMPQSTTVSTTGILYRAVSTGGNAASNNTSVAQGSIQSTAGATGSKTISLGTASSSVGHTVAVKPRAPATLTQASYRWFSNADNVAPGSLLATQNTASSVAPDAPFRLRQRIAADGNDVSASSGQYKLQYALKNGVCTADASTNETYDYIVGFTGASGSLQKKPNSSS